MARLSLTLLGCLGLAALGGIGAAGMELAASRRIGRGGNGASSTIRSIFTVGSGTDGREQGLGVGVQRVAEDVLRSAVLHQIARYMTPTVSEMYSTTDRSWEMKRYVRLYFSCRFFSRLMI